MNNKIQEDFKKYLFYPKHNFYNTKNTMITQCKFTIILEKTNHFQHIKNP